MRKTSGKQCLAHSKRPLEACCFTGTGISGLSPGERSFSPLPSNYSMCYSDKFLSKSHLQDALPREVEYSLNPKPRVKV